MFEGRFSSFKRRDYFGPLRQLITGEAVRRSVILLGPRRVGKTVLIHQIIGALLEAGTPGESIGYFSVDHPTYTGKTLEDLLDLYREAIGSASRNPPRYLFFDEIQYLRNWETQLKLLTDEQPAARFVASGSAAAALKLKSLESGAGRFTDFILPPLSFREFLVLGGRDDLTDELGEGAADGGSWPTCSRIEPLNEAFADYINFGGYPEVALNSEIRADPQRFIKGDIIDKVLLRDLPALYGIHDIQELNSLFTMLAFNTAQEVSLVELSQKSGVVSNTLKRYVEYLEAAFLVRLLKRVDRGAKTFQRQRTFKVYLTNPSMRSALFAPLRPDEADYGSLVETAVFSQWFHLVEPVPMYYARWKEGEVDLVNKVGNAVNWAAEVKYSDRHAHNPSLLGPIAGFAARHRLKQMVVTSKTISRSVPVAGVRIEVVPSSIYAYAVGQNVAKGRADRLMRLSAESD